MPRSAMTLVELLVVIAIVGLLAGLLLPAAGRALDEADLVACRNNLRNLGLAFRVYAKDHDAALPVSEVVDGPHAPLLEAMRHYADEPRLWYCPCETEPDRLFSEANVEAGRIGYFYFSCERPSRNRLVCQFLRWNVAWPRRLHQLMDSRTWVASDAWFSADATAHQGWKKGVNYLTLGGDVQFVTESPRQAFE